MGNAKKFPGLQGLIRSNTEIKPEKPLIFTDISIPDSQKGKKVISLHQGVDNVTSEISEPQQPEVTPAIKAEETPVVAVKARLTQDNLEEILEGRLSFAALFPPEKPQSSSQATVEFSKRRLGRILDKLKGITLNEAKTPQGILRVEEEVLTHMETHKSKYFDKEALGNNVLDRGFLYYVMKNMPGKKRRRLLQLLRHFSAEEAKTPEMLLVIEEYILTHTPRKYDKFPLEDLKEIYSDSYRKDHLNGMTDADVDKVLKKLAYLTKEQANKFLKPKSKNLFFEEFGIELPKAKFMNEQGKEYVPAPDSTANLKFPIWVIRLTIYTIVILPTLWAIDKTGSLANFNAVLIDQWNEIFSIKEVNIYRPILPLNPIYFFSTLLLISYFGGESLRRLNPSKSKKNDSVYLLTPEAVSSCSYLALLIAAT